LSSPHAVEERAAVASSLELIDRDIWIADGAPVQFFGFPYPTRMTVVRLADGALWVCSPIALTDPLAQAIERIGPPRYLVAPNKLHHLFLGEWQRRWPAARLYAAPGLARRRPDLHFAAELADRPEPGWAGTIDQVVFGGSFVMNEVAFFHRPSRTAIFTDLIQRFDPHLLRGWRGWVMRLDGLVGARGSTPREWRLTFVDRRALRRARAAALAWNPERVVIAHGTWIRTDGRAVLEEAFRWMG
jgi:Domain of unknown function (DUF4336)